MPISSGASGRRPASRPPPPAAARSTPNLAQQQSQQQQQPVGRMIDAPPKVEARRQLGSQTLYGSKPPWATDDDAAAQPPFYPPGGDLPHGEVARMRRIKAARQIYKSPQSRDRHTTGSVDDLLRDCTISDHSHSPSPVRRVPSTSSELEAGSRPNTRSISIGTDTMDNYRSEPDLTRRSRRRRGRDNDYDDDDGSVSDDSLDGGGRSGRARSSSRGRGRHRTRTESRGTSPPPQPPPPFRARPMPDFSRPLYVSTGNDQQHSPHSHHPQQQQRANGYGRTKMPPGLRPASERRYVPPQPQQHQPAPPIPKHDSSNCLPGDSPPFKARRMPDFSSGANPAPLRQPRSRSQSPAAAVRKRPAVAPAATLTATTTPAVVHNSSATSGYSSSPHRQRRERRRSMDEDSLTEAGSVRETASVSTEVLRPMRSVKADSKVKASDAVDSALKNLERQQLTVAPNAFPISDSEANFVLQQERLMIETGLRGQSQLSSCSSDDSYWQNFSAVSDLNRSLLDANQSESDLWEEVLSNHPHRQPIGALLANGSSGTQQSVSTLKLAPSSCHVCQKKVYPQERLALESQVYHKSCFKCNSCNKQLSLGSFAIYSGQPYCLAHDPSEQLKPAVASRQFNSRPGAREQLLEAGHEFRGNELSQPRRSAAPIVLNYKNDDETVQRQTDPQLKEENQNGGRAIYSKKAVQLNTVSSSQNNVYGRTQLDVKLETPRQRNLQNLPPNAPYIHAPLAPADSPAVRRSSQPVARESDVNDIRPEQGTARSLLDVWREREAAAMRPQGWRPARTVNESELPPEGAARSALRLWRDMEAGATRSSGHQQFKAAS